MTISVALINESTVVTQDEAKAIASALSAQVWYDFGPVWGVFASVSLVDTALDAPPTWWQLVILDDSDQAGALGYHDTTVNGLPLGKVFAKTTQEAGQLVSICASHELLEMLIDPECNLAAFSNDGAFYAYEVCDPVQADDFGYEMEGVKVSAFVFPSYFENGGKAPYDNGGHIAAPFSLAKGGYQSWLDVRSTKGWQQTFDDAALDADTVLAQGGRRQRRAQQLPNYSETPSGVHTKPQAPALGGVITALRVAKEHYLAMLRGLGTGHPRTVHAMQVLLDMVDDV